MTYDKCELWLVSENPGRNTLTFSRTSPARNPEGEDLVVLPRDRLGRVFKWPAEAGTEWRRCEVEVEPWLARKEKL